MVTNFCKKIVIVNNCKSFRHIIPEKFTKLRKAEVVSCVVQSIGFIPRKAVRKMAGNLRISIKPLSHLQS